MKQSQRRAALASCLLAVIGAGAAAQPAGRESLLDTVRRLKRVRIGVPIDLPPVGSPGSDGPPQGLDGDVARLVASKLDVVAELIPVPSTHRVAWLHEGKVDLVISTLGRTAERERLIDFSDDYSSFYLMVFGPKAMAVTAPLDMVGKSVSVTRSSVEDGELVRLGLPGLDIRRFDDNAKTLQAYVDGKVQLFAAGITAATALGIRHPALSIEAKLLLKESRNHIGLPRGEEAMRKRLNSILEEARQSGELRRITARWFSRTGMKG